MITERQAKITGVAECYLGHRECGLDDELAEAYARRAASEHSDDAIIADGIRQGRAHWRMLQRHEATA